MLMVKRLLLIAVIFILSATKNGGSGELLESSPPDPKSLKNWFAKDLKLNTEKVTYDDLLGSPGSDWLIYFKANHYSPLS
jgi:hypothetical protein